MCIVSAVGDYWRDGLPQKPYYPSIEDYLKQPLMPPQISRAEFDALKKDVEELKKLLVAAKKYDEAVGEPDCELEDKVALIKRLAKLVGVSMNEIFGEGSGG